MLEWLNLLNQFYIPVMSTDCKAMVQLYGYIQFIQLWTLWGSYNTLV